MKLLVVEDDPHILLGLQEVLRGEGYDVFTCNKGDQALAALQKHEPDLLLLDVMLPGKSGYDICRDVRKKNSSLPILMLTAKGQEIDKVIGLELGADDYVTKPFGVRELTARIQALLRRSGRLGAVASENTNNANETFRIGDAVIDAKRYEAKVGDGAPVELTPKELKLLQIFYTAPGEVLSRDRLLNDVWGYNYYGTTRTLDQVIVQLRKKIGDNSHPPKHLLTVYGVGYKLQL